MRYIALLALTKLLPTHPHLLTTHSNTILKCIDDADTSIRSRALDLIEGMVDRSNLQVIVRKLLSQLSPAPVSAVSALNNISATGSSAASSIASPSYKASLVQIILRMTTFNLYSNISNFQWFIDLLITLARTAKSLPSTSTGESNLSKRISDILIDVCSRVRAIRAYGIQQCIAVLLPEHLDLEASEWIVGEYSTELRSSEQWRTAIDALKNAGCLYAAVKVFARWCNALVETGAWNGEEEVREITKSVKELRDSETEERVNPFLASVK